MVKKEGDNPFIRICKQFSTKKGGWMDRLVKQMAKNEGVTEQLKSNDWLCWLQKMNSIRGRAEEIVLHDLIYPL